MSQAKFSELFTKLHKDPGFRARFAKNPAKALAGEGFDADKLALPSKIDPADLEHKLDRLFSGREAYVAPPAEAADMSADELWNKFSVIGKAGARSEESSPIVVAVVAYGAASVTGTPVVVGRAVLERRHSVVGPNNYRVENLNIDEVARLFIKLRRDG